MTENEKEIKVAIEHLKARNISAKHIELAIKALEEMQKIKELGDCYIIPKNSTWEVNGIDIHKALEEIQQYRAIGTVEELEWCKDASHWKELFKEKLEQHEAIGTIDEFKALKEKDKPKKTNSFSGCIHNNTEQDWDFAK